MTVLFDLSPVQSTSQSYFHGGGEYAKSLFQKLLNSKTSRQLAASYNPDLSFDPIIQNLIDRESVELVVCRQPEDFQNIIRTGKYRRFYSALPRIQYIENIDFGATEFMFTLHGLRVLEMPTDRYETRFLSGADRLIAQLKRLRPASYVARQKKIFETLITASSHRTTIITVSNHSKYAILYFFPYLDAEKIKVLHAPPTILQMAAETMPDPTVENMIKEKYGIEERGFFLLVSAKVWRKNPYRAIRAIDELYSKFSLKLKTLVLGCDDPRIFSVKNKEQFVFAPYASTEELSAIYRLAYCLIYPSLNEGYGYPPLESMAFGTPVICSSATSLPEICGDAVLFFNPYSEYELKNRILHLVHEPGAWEYYSKRGKEHQSVVRLKQDEALDEMCKLLMV